MYDISMRGSSGGLLAIGIGCLVLGGAFGALVTVGDNERFYGAVETFLVACAWVALLGAPGLLILLGLHGRPALLLPAAVTLVPLAFLSFAGVLLPLLIPAGIVFVAYRRRSALAPRPKAPAAVTTLLVVGLLVGAITLLFIHPDPRSYATANGSWGTSDVVTGVEAVGIIGLVAMALGLGWMLAEPRRP
jgi:hypothetical protein